MCLLHILHNIRVSIYRTAKNIYIQQYIPCMKQQTKAVVYTRNGYRKWMCDKNTRTKEQYSFTYSRGTCLPLNPTMTSKQDLTRCLVGVAPYAVE